ncbi:MAG: hypothetical protein GY705_11265 [Bacteroidetes bacterium]|nr:hypothetical protein [Bacteroidota bacterium]
MKGFVISDLHIFSKRSYAEDILNSMHEQIKNADFLVLNGDIFDFAWTILDSIDQTIHEAVNWLSNLTIQYPDCCIYYILGNHDSLEPFAKLLKNMTRQIKNITICDTHLVLGKHLFIHGDLPLALKNPWVRKLQKTIPKKTYFFHLCYEYAVKCNFHKLVYSYFSPKYCANRLCKILQKYPKDFLGTIEHIYFGHTHLPFHEYFHKNYFFHNTGASINGVSNNLIEVKYESQA